jgi:drug/metabolite transporter (DMT)-like permease
VAEPLSPSSGHAEETKNPTAGLLIALASHTGFGLYVVLSKDLFQHYPPFGLLACAFSFALLIAAPLLRKQFVWRDVALGSVWLVAGVAVLRSITKMLAVQYTLATTVQLVDLASPFFNALLAWAFLRETLPRGTVPALLAATVGAVLVIVVNPFDVHLAGGETNLLGIGLSVASALMMAVLVIVTNFSARQRSNATNVYLQQTFSLIVTYVLLSVINHESWAPFWHVRLADVAYLLAFFVVVLMSGGLTVFAMSLLNTTLFSTLLSLRLVVAILAGWLILGERLTSAYQWGGAIVVVVAITWYLWRQGTERRAASPGDASIGR